LRDGQQRTAPFVDAAREIGTAQLHSPGHVGFVDVFSPAVSGPADGGETGDYLTRLEQASITKSLENLLTFPYVDAAVKSGALALHGAYFDVSTGQVSVRHVDGYHDIAAEAGEVVGA
jgi:carbonic anhydrase